MSSRDAALVETGPGTVAVDADVAFEMDEEAFRGFYDRTARMLWVYLERLTSDRQIADDLLQESYYRLLSASIAFEGESHRRHYLFRIATNLARDRFRRRRVRPDEVSHEDDEAAGQPLAAPASGLDERLDLAAAFANLRSRERAMLWLAYAHGASHKEIAQVVGVGAGSVKTLLFRARRRLATLLDRQGAAR
jgi:RNA polymerase sigma-70 factor (ECF subfamily)